MTVLAHVATAYRLAARSADVVFVTPDGVGREGPTGDAAHILGQVRGEEQGVARDRPLRVLGDVLVFLDDDAHTAADRRARLDEVAGETPYTDALAFTGTATELADLVASWHDAGLDGARLRPAVAAHDLPRITRELVPELQRRSLHRTAYDADTLRGHLGLDEHPADRYARI